MKVRELNPNGPEARDYYGEATAIDKAAAGAPALEIAHLRAVFAALNATAATGSLLTHIILAILVDAPRPPRGQPRRAVVPPRLRAEIAKAIAEGRMDLQLEEHPTGLVVATMVRALPGPVH